MGAIHCVLTGDYSTSLSLYNRYLYFNKNSNPTIKTMGENNFQNFIDPISLQEYQDHTEVKGFRVLKTGTYIITLRGLLTIPRSYPTANANAIDSLHLGFEDNTGAIVPNYGSIFDLEDRVEDSYKGDFMNSNNKRYLFESTKIVYLEKDWMFYPFMFLGNSNLSINDI